MKGKYGQNFKFLLLLLLAIGFGLLLLSNSEKGLIHEFGVLFTTIVPILFCYEFILKRDLLAQVKKELNDVIVATGIEKKVLDAFIQTLPNSYQNIFDLGVSDAFPDYKAEDLKEAIETADNIDVRIIEIWIPFLDDSINFEVIVNSIIQKNCRYKILLSDPEKEDILELRARASKRGYSLERYKSHITENILFFGQVWQELKKRGVSDEDRNQLLEVRLHSNFLSSALFGFGDHFYLGLYLDGRLANKGMQFRINKNQDKQSGGTTFYKELDTHFNIQWDCANKIVEFLDDTSNWRVRDNSAFSVN
jgi:hypothetical protein